MSPVLTWADSAGDSHAHQASLLKAARKAAMVITALCPQRRACVQAGGHVGLWPLCLSESFAAVYTFEPDADNWRSLTRNAARPNVFAARGALGAQAQMVHLERRVLKSGHWFTMPEGPIPTYTVDGLRLPVLDALVLDVEGAELDVLRGAAETVARDHPLVWCEANALESVAAWLAASGYGLPQPGLKRDVYFQVAA